MIVPDYIERSKRKTLSLTILKNGNVIVKAPISMKDSIIDKFVEDKQDWIRSKLSIIKETTNKFDDVINYQKFLLYGNRYKLFKCDITKIETNDKFEILIPKKIEDEKILKNLKAWYKKVAREVLEDRLHFIESRVKLKSKALKIGDSRGRWGSCNSYGTISLNWRIIMLPPQIIDYVIIHELCHLVEMNHSKKFWSLVCKFLPNTEKLKFSIKGYSFLLNMF